MSLVSVQCPNCGSPVEAPPAGSMMRCPSCASILEIKTGSSGYPLASLAAIGQDTGFIAKRQAEARLLDRVDRLEAERTQIQDSISRLNASPRPGCAKSIAIPGAVIGLVGMCALMGSGEGATGASLLVGGVVAWVLFYLVEQLSHDWKVSVEQDRLATRLDEIDAEVAKRAVELGPLEFDLDRLTRELD